MTLPDLNIRPTIQAITLTARDAAFDVNEGAQALVKVFKERGVKAVAGHSHIRIADRGRVLEAVNAWRRMIDSAGAKGNWVDRAILEELPAQLRREPGFQYTEPTIGKITVDDERVSIHLASDEEAQALTNYACQKGVFAGMTSISNPPRYSVDVYGEDQTRKLIGVWSRAIDNDKDGNWMNGAILRGFEQHLG